MKKLEQATTAVSSGPDMLDEYDFRGGERGVYADRYAKGTNLVARSPDIAAVFPDSESVNAALRTLVRAARQSMKTAQRKSAKQSDEELRPTLVAAID